jgi:hypothetical protein
MTISRAAILAKPTILDREEIHVPAWGESVWVRCLTVSERDALEIAWAKDRTDFRARLLVACVCDENGIDIFEYGDIARVGEFPSPVMVPLADLALRLNGFTREELGELDPQKKDYCATNGGGFS